MPQPQTDTLLEGFVLGLHLLSVHNVDGLNNRNPGLSLRTPSGFSAGFFENSNSRTIYAGSDRRKRISYFAAWTFESPGQRFAFTGGMVSGYGRKRELVCWRSDELGCLEQRYLTEIRPIAPLLMPSMRLHLGHQLAARVAYSFTPQGLADKPLHMAHLMLEYRLGGGSP